METVVTDVIAIIKEGRRKAYTAINTAMVEAYWLVGMRIVEEEQEGKERAEYGTGLLKALSKELTLKYGNGYSPANLRNFRQFYLTYPDYEKCYALRSKLSWTHHRAIMRVENERAREYYIKETEEQNWNTRTLERNINTFYYERLLTSKDKESAIKHRNGSVKQTVSGVVEMDISFTISASFFDK